MSLEEYEALVSQVVAVLGCVLSFSLPRSRYLDSLGGEMMTQQTADAVRMFFFLCDVLVISCLVGLAVCFLIAFRVKENKVSDWLIAKIRRSK
jgi:hypothetical protein